jgi:hypothetical protein
MREMCGLDGAICGYKSANSCEECPVLQRLKQTQDEGRNLAVKLQKEVYKQ